MSELIYPHYSSTNYAISGVIDPRASIVAGSVTIAQINEYAYNINADEAQAPVTPSGTSFNVAGTLCIRTQLNNGCKMRFTPYSNKVTGFAVLADCGTGQGHKYTNFYVDGVATDTLWRPIDEGGFPSWTVKGCYWGYKNGVGGVNMAAGSHYLDIECPAIGGSVASQTINTFLVSAYDGTVSRNRVLIIGDSYTINNRSFVWHMRTLVQQHFPMSDLRFFAVAESGKTTADILSGNAHGLCALDIALMTYSPTLVIDVLGRNDNNAGPWTSTTKTNMDSVLSKVTAAGARLAWYCPVNAQNSQGAWVDAARVWAQANGVPFRDAGIVINQYPWLIYNTHPSNAGNEVLGLDMFRWFVDKYRYLI